MKEYGQIIIPAGMLVGMLIFLLKATYKQLVDLVKSVAELNTKMGIVLNDHRHFSEQIADNKREIDNMRARIHELVAEVQKHINKG